MGASEYYRYLGECDGLGPDPSRPQPYVGATPPTVDPQRLLPLYRAFESAGNAGLLRSAATPSLGGWGPVLARCVMASEFGLDVDLGDVARRAEMSADRFLFSESNGRLLATVRPADRERFEACFEGLPLALVGKVDARARLKLSFGDQSHAWSSADLSRAFKETLGDD